MSDHESLHHDEKRKKRMKLLAYIAAFAVFQVIVILVFVMVVMKVRTPKFRVGDGITVQSLTTSNGSSPSFDMRFTAPIKIKNNNFGPYKYDATTIDFIHVGTGDQLGQISIPKSKANFMSTKKLDVTVSVNSTALTSTVGLEAELNSGILVLNSQGRMNGKAEIVFIFKKKKAIDMNCTMIFNVPANSIRSVECK